MKWAYNRYRMWKNGAAGLALLICLFCIAYWYVWVPPLIVLLVMRAVLKRRRRKREDWQAQQQIQYAAWAAQAFKDEEIDGVLQWIKIDNETELAVMQYVREPDLKAVVRIATAEGLSEKSWKRSVRRAQKFNKQTGQTDVYDYITMNGKEYRVTIK